MQKNNDDIFNNLELVEAFAHITPDKVIKIVESIIKKKKIIKTRVYRIKGFGKMNGKSHEDLLIKSINILDQIRYLKTKQVIKLLKYLWYNNEAVRSEVLKSFEHLSQYNLFALRQLEFKIQQLILAELESWSNEQLVKNSPVVFVTTKELLTPSFEGRSRPDYKTFTLHSGSLRVSEELKNLRNRSILLLKKIYLISVELDQKIKVLQVLQQATHPPFNNEYGEDMEQMILNDVNSIVDFYLSILPNAENEIIQDIEEQKVWLNRRFTKIPPNKINELEEAIRSNTDYGMFRIFVGYDGRLDPDHDFNKDRETRLKKIEEFIANISETNFKEWQEKILSVVKNRTLTESGGYGYFESFLVKLAQEKPSLAIRLVEENEKELADFLINLITGIWKSNFQEKAKEIIGQWVEEGKYLNICAFIFVPIDDIDDVLFRKILDKAKKLKDIPALNNILRSILHNYPKYKHLKSAFLETIKELTRHKNFWWINNLWFKGDSIIPDLAENDFDIILSGLLLFPSIDYHAEAILKPIAEKSPEKVINFFHKRVEIKSKRKRDIYDPYDSVPFNFHELGGVLKQQEEIIIPLLLKWYRDGGKKYKHLLWWEASDLFEKIFSNFSPVLEKSLISLIKKGTKESRNIVLSIINKYEGGEFLWGVVKALIQKYFGTKEYNEVRDRIFGSLSQTGVVSGEDGFVRAFQEKKQSIQKFKKDPSKEVRYFVREYEDYLDERITHERRRTDEQIELMKRSLE